MKKTVSAVLAVAAVTVPAANTWAAAVAATAQAPATAKSKAKPATAAAKHTYTGPSVDMRWGPVQVSIIVQGTKILAVNATAPTERQRSAEINQQALPLLQQQILKQQGIKNVYAISGATMTSEAYGQSLQNALDQAHITR